MEADHILALVGGVALVSLCIVAVVGLVSVGAQIGTAIGRKLGLTR